jgi:hypothetical protein
MLQERQGESRHIANIMAQQNASQRPPKGRLIAINGLPGEPVPKPARRDDEVLKMG